MTVAVVIDPGRIGDEVMLGLGNSKSRGHGWRPTRHSAAQLRARAAARSLATLRAVASDISLVVFDFDGVFTSNMVYVSELGVETVRCSRADGIGLAQLARAGISSMILSTEVNLVVAKRARKLNVPCVQGCADKLLKLNELSEQLRTPLTRVAFLGNDVNDASCLRAVRLPAVVADAHSDVVPLASYRTRRFGGHGAVREFCDALLQARAS